MPIYQRPNKDIGVAQTISGTTTPFTVVALKNPASGQIVANTFDMLLSISCAMNAFMVSFA